MNDILVGALKNKLEHFAKSFSRCDEAFFIVLYKIVLDLMYVYVQAPVFGFYGFGFDFTASSLMIGWLLFFFGYLIIRQSCSDVCALFLYTLYLIGIVPQIIYFQFNEMSSAWMILFQLACLCVFRFLFGIRSSQEGARSRGISYKNKYLRAVATGFLLLYFVMMLGLYGLPSIEALSFYEVHNVRAAARDIPTLFSITQNIICKIFCPLYLLIAFKERKWCFFVLALLIQVYSYSVTGFKTFLFIPLILLCAQLIPSRNLKKIIVVCLPFGLCAMVLAYLVTDEVMIYALIGNRVFFLPAEIKCYYFDYFSAHGFIGFSQSTIASFMGIASSYSANVPNLIGTLYFGKPEMWANTGFLADGYANLGFVGMVAVSVLIAAAMICSRIALERTSLNLQKELQAVFLLYFISLNDGGAISVLFSGGLIIVILLVYIVDFGDDTLLEEGECFEGVKEPGICSRLIASCKERLSS